MYYQECQKILGTINENTKDLKSALKLKGLLRNAGEASIRVRPRLIQKSAHQMAGRDYDSK